MRDGQKKWKMVEFLLETLLQRGKRKRHQGEDGRGSGFFFFV